MEGCIVTVIWTLAAVFAAKDVIAASAAAADGDLAKTAWYLGLALAQAALFAVYLRARRTPDAPTTGEGR
ncbi:hypothetical protein [Allokutzneria albata]|uniref:Uncharacterized protein n=1 Tax=Allokutzneria albata TaxID=211114 RepID=A0A1H0DTM2_ALLAB|nr:hypothetical protein [Allokutzneria albata]SDN73409.1 hypothetical protein SAMN04489726_7986 [Allokutzneria albata]